MANEIISGDFSRGYSPAEAERGKFVVLDPTTITGLPSSSNGRYALLVYHVNSDVLQLSSSNVIVSSVIITNDITVDHINDPIIIDEIQNTVSVAETVPVSSIQLGTWNVNATVNNTISAIQQGIWETDTAITNAISAYQLGTWNTNSTINNSISSIQQGNWSVSANITNPVSSIQQGNWNTRVFDSWGDHIGTTIMDQLMVTEPHRISGGVFNAGGPDTQFQESTITANATISVSAGIATLATTADSGSSIYSNAKSLARYVGANMNTFRSVARFGDTGTANNARYIGVYNGPTFTDGFFFKLDGTTFKIGSKTSSGTESLINSGSFNGSVTSWTVDTNFHTFEILYSNKSIYFYIDGVYVHSIVETTAAIAGTRHFKPFIANVNTGIGSVCYIHSQVLSITRYGQAVTQAKTYFQEGTTAGVQLKIGPGSIHLLNISAITNNSVITLYDGTSTAGRRIWSSGTMSSQTIPFAVPLDSAGGTPFEDGLFLVITGANSNCFVKYE